jgi:hypothetical protein
MGVWAHEHHHTSQIDGLSVGWKQANCHERGGGSPVEGPSGVPALPCGDDGFDSPVVRASSWPLVPGG